MSETFKWCHDKTKLGILDKHIFCIDRYGTKVWYLNGKKHRLNGPAIKLVDGNKAWCLNDKLHRENGPAVEYAKGGKDWWLHGRHYSESAYWKELQK